MNPSLWQLDYLVYLQNFREISNHIFDSFFLNISYFGLQEVTYYIIFGIYWCYNKQIGRFMINCHALTCLANIFLKLTFCIYRPWILDSRIHPLPEAFKTAPGYSFPSGHTAGVVSCFGSLCISFWKNKLIRFSSFVIIFLVMLSRNYLGVHTPQDIFVSFVVSFLIILGIKKIFENIDSKKHGYGTYVLAIAIICILIGCYISFKSYPIDYLNGKILFDPKNIGINEATRIVSLFALIFGCYLEKKFVDFDPKKGNIFEKIIRLILGILLYTFIENKLNLVFKMFLSGNVARGFALAISGLFLTFIYPCFIKLFQLNIRKNK